MVQNPIQYVWHKLESVDIKNLAMFTYHTNMNGHASQERFLSILAKFTKYTHK